MSALGCRHTLSRPSARVNARRLHDDPCKSILFVFCGRSLAPNTRLPTAIGQRFRSMQRCAWRRLGGVHRRLPRCTRDTEEFSGSIMARNLRACPVESHARRFAMIHQHHSSIRVGRCNTFFHDVDLDILCADRSQLLLWASSSKRFESCLRPRRLEQVSCSIKKGCFWV